MSEARDKNLSVGQAALSTLLGPLVGGRIVGGCDRCDAYQTVVEHAPAVWGVNIHHDDDCPVLRSKRGH